MTICSDVAVVIRTCGERTLEICKQLVEEQVEHKNIVVINEIPFSKAVRKTFEIGLDYHLPWTLAIDADVLIAKNAIREVIKAAHDYDQKTFKFTGRVCDKLFLKPRAGGIHLYRSCHLEAALKIFPTEEFIRPETQIADMLQQKGNLSNPFLGVMVGIHDYEQWYRDIYRKAFVHANKHGNSYVTGFLRNWSKRMNEDNDYKVALVGLCHGIAAREKIVIDIRKLPMNYEDNELLNEIVEKPPLNMDSMEGNPSHYVESILYAHRHPRLSELKAMVERAGPIRVVPGLFFYMLNKLSRRGWQWANHSR